MLNQATYLPTTPGLLSRPSDGTDETSALEGEFRRHFIERMLPAARSALGLGLLLVTIGIALDRALLPTAGAGQDVPIRVMTGFLPLALALIATFRIKNRAWLPYLYVAVMLLTGVASMITGVLLPGSAGQFSFWCVTFITLITYLLLGLTLRQGVLVGWPLLLAYVSSGLLVGTAPHALAYSAVFLVFLNLAGTGASFLLERDARELFNNRRELTRLVSTDGLTGLFTRRAFDRHLRQLWKQAQREYEDIAIVVADIDHFKLYNDCYGHKMGDDCIKAVASVLAASVNRPLDIVARYGGEEYVIVLYDPSAAFLDSFAQGLCQRVADLKIEHKGSEATQCVSLSIGAAITEKAGSITAEQLIRQADDALYEAKTQGRNRAVVYRSEWGQHTTAHLAAMLT